MSAEPVPSPLRPLGAAGLHPSGLDADSAWLRAAVECFEPRLRQVEARDATTPGAWDEPPGAGCGWVCGCCPERAGGARPLDLDRLLDRPLGRGFRRRGERLADRLARAAGRCAPAVLGLRTDPYAGPAARRGRTRTILEICREVAAGTAAPGLQVALVTGSPLVVCDRDLLVALDAAGAASVELVVAAPENALARRLEPAAPATGERLAAAAELAAEGLAVRLRLRPLLPGIGDGEALLRPFLRAAAAAGVQDVVASPLRLPRRGRRRFLAWLAAERPELVATYRRQLGRGGRRRAEDHRQALAELDRLRLEHGFPRALPGRG